MKIIVGLVGRNPCPSCAVDGYIVDGVVIPTEWVEHERNRLEEERKKRLAKLDYEDFLDRIKRRK